MTSAVAVVDPNAEGEGQDDPKDALDELDKKHKAEGKKHHEDLKGAHEDEANQHADGLDEHHQHVAGAHDEAQDAQAEAAVAREGADADQEHVEKIARHKHELHEHHEKEKDQAAKELDDKHQDFLGSLFGKLDTRHVGELVKQGETHAKGFFDNLADSAKNFVQQHVGDVNDLVGKLVSKGHDELHKVTGELDKAFEKTHLSFLSDAEKQLTSKLNKAADDEAPKLQQTLKEKEDALFKKYDEEHKAVDEELDAKTDAEIKDLEDQHDEAGTGGESSSVTERIRADDEAVPRHQTPDRSDHASGAWKLASAVHVSLACRARSMLRSRESANAKPP